MQVTNESTFAQLFSPHANFPNTKTAGLVREDQAG
jgi:hypothetical protein